MSIINVYVDDPDDAPTAEEIIAKAEKDGIKNPRESLVYVKISAEYFNEQGVDGQLSSHFGGYLVLSRPLEHIERYAVESIIEASMRSILRVIPNPILLTKSAIEAELYNNIDREKGL